MTQVEDATQHQKERYAADADSGEHQQSRSAFAHPSLA